MEQAVRPARRLRVRSERQRQDGREGHYGFYWHNPGVGVGSSGNPNTANKSATYSWDDQKGCAGCIKVDPNIKAPYSHEASVWLERQLTNTMGVRAGFVYKTEDDLISTYQRDRGLSAYTVPFTFVDIGVDGVRNTADDRNITMLGFPTAQGTAFPTTSYVMNLPEFGRYKTVEVSGNKRYGNKMSASFGGNYTWLHNFPNGYPQNPNQPFDQERSTWSIKATASYDAPFQIRISPVLRHQSGLNFARTLSISTPSGSGLSVAGTTAYAEPSRANREDNITVFDVRVEKTVNLTTHVRVRGFLDGFNLSNSRASETISRATGLSYLKPSAILAPRTARLGFRFMW